MQVSELKQQAVKADKIYVRKALMESGKKRVFIVNKRTLDILNHQYPNSNFPVEVSSVDLTFRDIHTIIQAISEIEIEKYGNSDMVADFLRDCVYESDFSKLDKYYEITSEARSSKNVDPFEWKPLWKNEKKSMY